MQSALSKALMGKENISGRLPISIPGMFDIGSGIFLEKKFNQEEKKQFSPGKLMLRVRPQSVDANISNIEKLMDQAVNERAWPGGVLLAAKDGNIFYQRGHGYHTYDKKKPTRSSDIFDLASITKVVSTTSAIMKLQDLNKIDINKPVVKYLPEFKGATKKHISQKSSITIKDLLAHVSGLPPFKKYYETEKTKTSLLKSIYSTDPIYENRDTTIYSDVGAIILGQIVEKVSGLTLDVFVDSMVFEPLGMGTTFFNPPKEKKHRIVPTEISKDGRLIHGYVHDENAYALNGIAGHAGLFSTVKDIAVFSQMMLNGGLYGWKRIFKNETVNQFTNKANILENSSRLLGWDSPDGQASGGVYLSDSSFGHTGFTGTSLWIDPDNKIIVVLLTNAVHPNRNRKSPSYYDWRQRIHSSVYEALSIVDINPKLKLRAKWDNME
jgi:CubicO group peptidase (beta-lactamase class C family)